MGEFVPRTKTLGGNIPCLASPELARKRQKALSARAELRAERLLRAQSNLETPVETQADGAPLFRISDLSAGYDKKVVVEGVDLEVRAGDVVALIGPNGSGKSTILKSLIRQLALIGGTVYLDGKSLQTLPERDLARTMSVLLTEHVRPELMTCWDVAAAGRYPYTGRLGLLSDEDRAKVDEALALVGADELAGRDFSCISDGQRQRVLLARAICQEPEVIVLDEPPSFLGLRYELELLTVLKQLVREKQVAVILSLHEIDLAQKLSDRLICVHNG